MNMDEPKRYMIHANTLCVVDDGGIFALGYVPVVRTDDPAVLAWQRKSAELGALIDELSEHNKDEPNPVVTLKRLLAEHAQYKRDSEALRKLEEMARTRDDGIAILERGDGSICLTGWDKLYVKDAQEPAPDLLSAIEATERGGKR
jgi:hypothetical protein